ncbi:MAG: hypothetical protein ACMUIP_12125 [bacterium]
MKNKKNLLPILLLIFLCGFSMVLSGCSGGAEDTISSIIDDITDTTDTDTDTDTDTTPQSYNGLATVLGSINLSSLIPSDWENIGSSSGGSSLMRKRRGRDARISRFSGDPNVEAYIFDPNREAVKLYIMGSDGELQDTNIVCSCTYDEATEELSYNCPEVAGGYNYIVKYIKLLGNNQAVELKAETYVPPDATAETQVSQEVSAQTTAVVQCLTNAILEATSGLNIDAEDVKKIVDAVKEVIVTLVAANVIQIPSMIVETDGDTLDEVLGEKTENTTLSQASGAIVYDDSVSGSLDVVKNEIESEQYSATVATTDETKIELVRRVFKVLIDDDDEGGGAPPFMIEFFGDKYVEGAPKTVGQLFDAINAGLWLQPGVSMPAAATKSGAMAAFSSEIENMYTLLAKDPNILTAADKLAIAEYPPVIRGLFPSTDPDQDWSSVSTDTVMNVPQAIAFTIYVVEDYLWDVFEDAGLVEEATVTEGDGGKIEYEEYRPFDFNPMGPNSLMDLYDFAAVAENYSGLEIFDLWLHPGIMWLEGDWENGIPGREVDSLHAGACWGDALSFMAAMDPDAASAPTYTNVTVTLTYPTRSGGRKTIALVDQAGLYTMDGDDPFNDPVNCYVLDPWMEAHAEMDINSYEPVHPDPNRIVSDFTSGIYTVNVIADDETVDRSFDRLVITGMSNIFPVITSPAQYPNWPGEMADPNVMEAYYEAQANYEMTNFAATTYLDPNQLTGEYDAAKITITWDEPDIDPNDIPDGVKMGYELDVGKGGCDQNGCYWEQIYATWEKNKLLFGNSFTIPRRIAKQDDGEQPYNVNMHIVFIDSRTGEHLGQGGHANAQFTVQEPLDPNATFTINGSATLARVTEYWNPNTGMWTTLTNDPVDLSSVSKLKAGLCVESYNPDLLGNQWTRDIVRTGTIAEDPSSDGARYTIQAKIKDFLGNTTGWTNIIVWHDINDNNEIDDSLDTDPWHEPQWWPTWNSDIQVHFDTWGGMLRVRREQCLNMVTDPGGWEYCNQWQYLGETVVRGGETVTGQSFDVDFWYNPAKAEGNVTYMSINFDQVTLCDEYSTATFDLTLYKEGVIEAFDSTSDFVGTWEGYGNFYGYSEYYDGWDKYTLTLADGGDGTIVGKLVSEGGTEPAENNVIISSVTTGGFSCTLVNPDPELCTNWNFTGGTGALSLTNPDQYYY